MNILLIAPEHPDLPNIAAEIAAISKQHETVRLTGTVRDADIAHAVQEGPYDVIWFASHGGPDGIILSDGKLSIEGVGQYLKASGACLCVLNTCSSENVALSIISGSNADVICTIGDVGDRAAARLAILLAGALARTDDPHEAFLAVRPEGGKYRYYHAGISQPDTLRRYHSEDSIQEIRERLARIETTLALELQQIRSELNQLKAMPLTTRMLIMAVAVVVGIVLSGWLQRI